MKNENQKLIFVYNAKSGAFNAVFDAIHKAVRPGSYKCTLCKLTYSFASMNGKWRKFINNLKIAVDFLHKDEFKQNFNYKNPKFPAAFLHHNNKMKQLISPAEINRCKSINELMELVKDKVKAL